MSCVFVGTVDGRLGSHNLIHFFVHIFVHIFVHNQIQVAMTGLCLSFSTPLCCALFPQEASIKLEEVRCLAFPLL